MSEHPLPESEHHEPMPEGEEAPPPGVQAMALVRWALLLAVALLSAFSLARHFELFAPAAQQGQLYTCPMHPEIVQAQPGQCPICSMDLVPKGAAGTDGAEAHGAQVVELLGERAQRLGVKTAKVVQGTRSPTLDTVGVVEEDESRMARVHTRSAGYVEQLPVNKTFTRVNKGQVLLALYSPELLAAQRELLNAQRWAKQSPEQVPLLEAAREKLFTLGLSEADLEALLRASSPQRTLPLRAPLAGVVTRKEVVLGGFVEAGALLFELTDLSQVWLMVEVAEHEAAAVVQGAEARIQVAGEVSPRSGVVDLVYPTSETTRRSARMRIKLANKDLTLRPGMSARVSLALPPTQGLFVPRSAIIDTGHSQHAFVARDATHFEKRRLRAVPAGRDEMRVLEGLAPGDTVVVSASFLLDSETRLKSPVGEPRGHDASAPADPPHAPHVHGAP